MNLMNFEDFITAEKFFVAFLLKTRIGCSTNKAQLHRKRIVDVALPRGVFFFLIYRNEQMEEQIQNVIYKKFPLC